MDVKRAGRWMKNGFFGFVLRAMRGMTVGEETTDATV
jgi:hypothetical protein